MLCVLESLLDQAFVATTNELLEGNVEVGPVARLGDRSEGLPPMQDRQ